MLQRGFAPAVKRLKGTPENLKGIRAKSIHGVLSICLFRTKPAQK